MTLGIKDTFKAAVDSVVTSTEGVDDKAEKSGSSLLDRLGDRIFGTTAESETDNAQVISPDADITPVTQGRRSRRSDGQDPFHNEAAKDAPAPADKS